MSGALAPRTARWDVLVRWGLSATGVLVVHGLAMMEVRRIRPDASLPNQAPVLELDLAPMPLPPKAAAAPAEPLPAEPLVAQPVAEARPPPANDSLPSVVTQTAPEPLALPRPLQRKRLHAKEPRHRPPVEMPEPSASPPPEQAQPQQNPGRPGAASASWESALAAHLASFKRYPVAAQRRGEQGIALIRFSIDRTGMVHGIALARSTGHADLDREAESLVGRAQPLPKPPPQIPGNSIDLVVPIGFSLR